jgi:PPOX class probable F420-dependent enzyme
MLDPRVRELCAAKNFAAFTTLFADGVPQTNVMWVDCDDDHILINTEVHRAKAANVAADPRVNVMIWEAENPYTYAEVRGRVVETVTGDAARKHIDVLAQKYMGMDYPNPVESERVILRIAPDRQLLR